MTLRAGLSDGLRSLAARVFALLCVGVVVAAALAFTVSDLQRREGERRDREARLADRAADLTALLQRAPPGSLPRRLGAGPEAARLTQGAPAHEPTDEGLTARLAERLGPSAAVRATDPAAAACAPAPPPRGPVDPPPPPDPGNAPRGRAPPPPPRPECRRIALTLASGERVAMILPAGPPPPRSPPLPFGPFSLGVLAAAAAALAYVVARLTTAPVRRLAEAAEALGRDLDRPPLPEAGPTEVRQGARAFNVMQAQLRQREAERTHMLAAISHDLQTPLTRMRLRVEKVGDPALRSALLADGETMLEMIRDGLDLARAAGGGGAPLRRLDLDSLLDSLCEDAVAAGAAVTVAERCGVAVHTRPESLKRCVANLLENALKHAGAAELAGVRRDGGVELEVRDRGPGVPEDQLSAILEPFVRLDTSRSRETGGVGLGLTIARLMAEQAGAELSLSNRPGGGLCARVRLRDG